MNLWLPNEEMWDSEDGNLAHLAMSPIIEVKFKPIRYFNRNFTGKVLHIPKFIGKK